MEQSTDIQQQPEKQLRSGIDMIIGAFDSQNKSAQAELGHWKQVANTQRQKIVSLETELAQLTRKLNEQEKTMNEMREEKRLLVASRNDIVDKYNTLRKNALQLDTFRKQIASMLELSPTAPISEAEASFIDAAVDSHSISVGQRKGSPPVKPLEAMTNQKMSKSFSNVNSNEKLILKPFFTDIPLEITAPNTPDQESNRSLSAPNISSLYKQIRKTISSAQFEQFAANIAKFNTGVQSAEETNKHLATIIPDPALLQQMQFLVSKSVAESTAETFKARTVGQ